MIYGKIQQTFSTPHETLLAVNEAFGHQNKAFELQCEKFKEQQEFDNLLKEDHFTSSLPLMWFEQMHKSFNRQIEAYGEQLKALNMHRDLLEKQKDGLIKETKRQLEEIERQRKALGELPRGYTLDVSPTPPYLRSYFFFAELE
jgi:septal ring factor EnvC (AmiA/AmiB activator)